MAKAIYGKYNALPVYATKTCTTCGGSGKVAMYPYCSYCGSTSVYKQSSVWKCRNCGRSDDAVMYSQTCRTCNGIGNITTSTISGYKKGTFIAEITAEYGSLPQNGKHSDGYWYVFEKMLSQVWVNFNGVWKKCSCLSNVSGVWKKGEMKKNINGIWK